MLIRVSGVRKVVTLIWIGETEGGGMGGCTKWVVGLPSDRYFLGFLCSGNFDSPHYCG